MRIDRIVKDATSLDLSAFGTYPKDALDCVESTTKIRGFDR